MGIELYSRSQQSDEKASTRLGNHLGRSRRCYFGLGSHFLSQFGQLDPCRQVGAAVTAKHRWGSSSEQSHRKASTRLRNHLGMLFGCSSGLGSRFLSQFCQLDPCRQVGAVVTAKHRWGSSSEKSEKKASTRLRNHLGRSRGCYFGLGSHFLSQFGQLDPCRQVGAAVTAKHRWGSSSEQSHRKASTRLRNHLGMLVGCSSRLG